MPDIRIGLKEAILIVFPPQPGCLPAAKKISITSTSKPHSDFNLW